MDTRRLDGSLLRFLAVIDEGSLIRGARSLGSHQPTLSRQVAELESQLGAPLVERTGHGLLPTALAQSIVDDARQMAAAAEGMLAMAQGAASGVIGAVRVACSQVLGVHLLPPLLARLHAQRPQLQFELVLFNAVSNLLRREANIALRRVAPAQSSLRARRLGAVCRGPRGKAGQGNGSVRGLTSGAKGAPGLRRLCRAGSIRHALFVRRRTTHDRCTSTEELS